MSLGNRADLLYEKMIKKKNFQRKNYFVYF